MVLRQATGHRQNAAQHAYHQALEDVPALEDVLPELPRQVRPPTWVTSLAINSTATCKDSQGANPSRWAPV
jgi:hypothetical protein